MLNGNSFEFVRIVDGWNVVVEGTKQIAIESEGLVRKCGNMRLTKDRNNRNIYMQRESEKGEEEKKKERKIINENRVE